MQDWIADIPMIDRAFAGAWSLAMLVGLGSARRGGRFRALPGWVAFWLVFAAILVALSRLSPTISLPCLGLLMFAGLRAYFFQVPMRPQDRLVLVAAFVSVPLALYPGFNGSSDTFLATAPVIVLLLFPAMLAGKRNQAGFLDASGRLLMGVLLYVFCAAHLGLMVRWEADGLYQLFGILVIAAELPQRILGRLLEVGWIGSIVGLVVSAVLAGLAGFNLAPLCGLVEEDGARAGLLVVVAVTLASLVGQAMARDLGQSSSDSRVGRGAFLDRSIPALYAAPVYFHYLNHFA